MNARDFAERAQNRASDPAVSAFVAASAGSGKTKLLTDRLLRLMLGGAEPARIQCLTFTRAAAAEMTLRLQARLSRWVTLDDPRLDAELAALLVAPSPTMRDTARALFARVLDLPGGMRIGTIHAFCQSLLRRFPLEAALSPHFRLVDDIDAASTMQEAREDMLAAADTPDAQAALALLAGLASIDRFGALVQALHSDRDRLARLPDALDQAQRRALGVTHEDDAALVSAAVRWPGEAEVTDALRRMQARGAPGVIIRAGNMLGWLSLPESLRIEHWAEWLAEFVDRAGEPRKLGSFPNSKLAEAEPHLRDVLAGEQTRLLAIEDQRRALRMAALSAALVRLAQPVMREYDARKGHGGLLDYADLIGRTQRLLIDPGAAWVLYKLDGGLDHLLLDEVQDTAPAQWRIAGAMTDEFFAGLGQREGGRTVFAVGDRKQSIFSFQGADPDGFDAASERWRARVTGAGETWHDVTLDVSFRSTAPVLALVDAVFADPEAAAGVVRPGETLRHLADRAGHAGSVELWPLAPAPLLEPPPPWTVPDRNLGLTSARQRLADHLAEWLHAQTGGSVALQSQDRMLAPGDVMVLVRRRDAFARSLVRALKARGVPVAGLDRMVLTDQPAVQDLIALGEALLLPQDDLTLACVLTSPLGFLSDDSLMALAAGRSGTLWDTLRDRAAGQPDWSAAWHFLSALLARVDYATPYALLAEALGPLRGRARLFARLGAEAGEPIDEFLNAALTYARTHPPSLQGFLHWLRRSAAMVKREAEGAGGGVRIMTVHGAKGLQAPLVVLPDTTALPKESEGILWAQDAQTGAEVPLFAPNKAWRCNAAERLRQAALDRAREEYNRLLYVALTRAEDRLVVCGWQPSKAMPDGTWYSLIERGMAALSPKATPFVAWEGTVLSYASPQTLPAAAARAAGEPAPSRALPAWAGAAPEWRPAPLPVEPARPMPLAPSRPEGVALGIVPQAISPLAVRDMGATRFRRGQVIHALLQHLPALPPALRAAAAASFVARPGAGLPPGTQDAVVAETLAILAHPDLAAVFGPGSRAEVPLTGVVADSVVGGLVDRLVVLPDCVMLADFKTNREPPRRVEDTPALYLRQLAAYRAILRGIFPDRPVRCVLVWTHAARVVALPDALLDRHAPSNAQAA